MWLYSENIAGTHLNFDIGRLDFEDDRRWWWDDELDAVRVAYERETLRDRAGRGARARSEAIRPERRRPRRRTRLPRDRRGLLGLEAEPRGRALPAVSGRSLAHREPGDGGVGGARRRLGCRAHLARRARLPASSSFETRGYLGYWLDTALVIGDEKVVEFDELSRHQSVVDGALPARRARLGPRRGDQLDASAAVGAARVRGLRLRLGRLQPGSRRRPFLSSDGNRDATRPASGASSDSRSTGSRSIRSSRISGS